MLSRHTTLSLIPFPVYRELERVSLLIGADMTLTFEKGNSICGVSTSTVFDLGRRTALVATLFTLAGRRSYCYLEGKKRNAYAKATPMPASHPA
jgi:hypothetical protein